MKHSPITILFMATGLLALCGATFNSDWFLNRRKTRAFVSLLGRTGARIFYGLLGGTLLVLGYLISTGVIDGPAGAYGR